MLTLAISKQTKHTYTENTPVQVIRSQSTLTAGDMNLQELVFRDHPMKISTENYCDRQSELCRGAQLSETQDYTETTCRRHAARGLRKYMSINGLYSTTLSRPEKSLPQNGNLYAT